MTRHKKIQSIFKSWFLIPIFILGLCGAISSCSPGGGANLPGDAPGGDVAPFAPPAPPIELPNDFSLPSSLTIDVEKAQNTSDGGALSAAIKSGATAIFLTYQNLELVVFPLVDAYTIPVSTDLTSISLEAEGLLPIKIDFSDFDLDGDGNPEGCTGCTCPTGCATASCPTEANLEDLQPICLRVWIKDPQGGPDFFPSAALRLDRIPIDEENRGAGEYRFVQPAPIATDPALLVRGSGRWDHANLPDRFTKSFVRLPEISGDLDDSHAEVTQEGENESALKTLRITKTTTTTADDIEEELLYAARYFEDNIYWSGSVEDFLNNTFLTNECGLITTGQEINRDTCLELGIDVEDLQFLDPLTEDDLTMPSFPATLPP